MFDEGTNEHREAISEYVLHGLGYLAEELRYEGEHGDDSDVPLLRWRCTQLASSMLKAGLGDRGCYPMVGTSNQRPASRGPIRSYAFDA